MREIKFRAWSKESEKMIHPDENGYFHRVYIGENGYWQTVSLQRVLGKSNVEIMQYTGLTDKCGTEIYEGDIVEYKDFNSLRTGGHSEDKIIVGKVIFSCGMWMVEENNRGHDLYEALVNDEELEVIGNIYQNPELLEEKQ